MKTIFNILVILVVAVLVGGLFYGIVTAASSGISQSSISERPANGQLPADGEFNRPDREGAGRIQFPAESVKNLAIISIIGVICLNAIKWLDRKKSTVKVAQ